MSRSNLTRRSFLESGYYAACMAAFSFTDETCPKCGKDVYSAVDELAEYQAK